MKPELSEAFDREMAAARMAWTRDDLSACFSSLERAHILGQRNLWPHILTHAWMLRVGWKRRDYREVFGQVIRLIATFPGALFGWVPEGNTGGANVSALKPMPIPKEFKPYFAQHSMAEGILARLVLLAVIIVLVVSGYLTWTSLKQSMTQREINTDWAHQQIVRAEDLGSTNRLEIIPLVNWHASSSAFKTEPGVSYLVRTDHATLLFDLGFNKKKQATPPLLHAAIAS